MNPTCFVFVLFFLGAAASSADVPVQSGGSQAAYPLYQQLSFGWQLLDPAWQFLFEQLTSVRGINALVNGSLVWAASEIPANAVQAQQAHANGMHLHMMPTALLSVVPFANYGSLGVTGLRISKRVLGLIWLGNVSRWNDPAIVATNPKLAGVDRPIRLVVQDVPIGTLTILQTAIAKLLQPGEWPYNVSTVWPAEVIARWGDRVVYSAASNPATFSAVLSTPYSLGYVVQSMLIQMGISPAAFALVDANSSVADVLPDAAGLTAAADATVFDPATNLALGNSSLPPDAWPIYGFTYAVFNDNYTGMTASQCQAYQNSFHFFYWLLTEPEPRQLALGIGYAITPLNEARRLVAQLSAYRCHGGLILATQFEAQRDEAVWDAMLVIAMVSLCLPALLALAAGRKMLDRSGSLCFILSTAVGSALLLIAVILFYLLPSHTSICIVRTFLVGLGFVLLASPVSTKVMWCLWLMKKSNELKAVEVSPTQLLLPLLVALALQITLLVVWAAVDPYSSTVVVTNQFLNTAVYICSSNDNWIWFGIEIGFFAALLLTAFVLYWAAGNTVLRSIHDVAWMGFTLYNLLFLMVLLIPLLAGFDNPEDQQYFIISVGLIFPALFTSCTLYGPIVFPNIFHMMSSTISRITKSSSQSSSHRAGRSEEPQSGQSAHSAHSGQSAHSARS